MLDLTDKGDRGRTHMLLDINRRLWVSEVELISKVLEWALDDLARGQRQFGDDDQVLCVWGWGGLFTIFRRWRRWHIRDR